MKRSKSIGKIFGIALVFVMVWTILGTIPNITKGITNASIAYASSSSLPSTIRVLRLSTGTVDTIDFKLYTKRVLPQEWIASWPSESLKAGAMAVKTYAWYWIEQGGRHPPDADVCDGTHCQVYKEQTYSATNDAVEATWLRGMKQSGALFNAQYWDGRAVVSTGGAKLNIRSGPGATDPVIAQANDGDELCVLSNGLTVSGGYHRFFIKTGGVTQWSPGSYITGWVAGEYVNSYWSGQCIVNYADRMTQWGSKYWADQGKDYQWILSYFYPGISFFDIAEDTVPPAVNAFSVIPSSVTSGNAFTISYTVSDTGGSGLGWIQLWRKYETASWEQVDSTTLSGVGNGPYSGSFSDTPLTVGTYWYGIHVGDDVGNWATETDSGFSPIQVEVIQANNPPQLSSGYVNPSSGTPSTNFYYYVTYFDPDGDSPSIKQVYIDGIAYTMTWYSGLNSHITYRYGPKNLSAGGTHYYFFYFEDGKGGTGRLPSGIDMYLGPSVTPETYPPQVTTEGASSITTSSATVTGNLDSTGGETCQVWFEYGLSTSYGISTSKLSVSSTGPFSSFISSLNPDTTYHFRACASNSKGTSYGSDMTFKTAKETYPPQVTTDRSSSVTTSSAVLTGYLDSTGGETCQVWFEYGTTTSYGSSTSKLSVSSTGPFSAFISSLSLDTTYHFRACAQNTKGTNYGSDMTFTTTADQVVTLPDPNLEAAIREAIGKPTGDIYQSDLEWLTSLYASWRNISDLTGLEHCTDLKHLDLSWNNQISDISPLSNLTSLTYLELTGTQISDITTLSDLTSLIYLGLVGNQISDISALSNLTSLTSLWLGGNQISDISALSNLTSLTSLGLECNQISDISAISNLTSLTYLALERNQISDIPVLSNLTSLTYLALGYNQISNISVLSNLTSLTCLHLQANQISDISALSNLTSLTELGLGYNQISNISALSNLTSLTGLALVVNQISDISALSNLIRLAYVYLQSNRISDIQPLVDNSGLEQGDIVDLTDNPLNSNSLNIYIPQLQARGVNVAYNAPRTWHVDDDLVDYPAADFTKIQDAVDAASSGDTIIVYPGIYTENVDVNKDHLTIQSQNGAETTIVQAANPDDHVFEITANYVNVRGFMVRGATTIGSAGINLDHADYCNISDNSVLNNFWGIQLHYSNNNNLTNNSVNSNGCFGIDLISSSSNSLTSNSANSNSLYGIYLYWSSNNALTNNVANSNGESGIYLCYSGYNNLANNTMSGNKYNFTIYAHYLTDFINNVDTSNKVDGKPVYYWIDEREKQIPTDAGFVAIVNCRNITVRDLTLANNYYGVLVAYSEDSKLESVNTSNNHDGIYLCFSSNNSLTNNTARDNYNGIYLFYSDTNTLTGNIASYNTGEYGIALIRSSSNNLTNNIASWNHGYGIYLQSSSNNNSLTNNTAHSNTGSSIMLFDNSINNCIYLNNFTNVYSSSDSTNIWNSPAEITYTYNGNTYTSYLGNYWDDYTGSDANGDGIGETSYPIDSDADNYPLVEPFENYEIGPVPPEEWSFAIITDLHIGRGYPDYGGEGWNDTETVGQDYYLTERLQRVVDTIIDLKKTQDIRFVVVLGDISDSGEYSELEKARDILDGLNYDVNGDGKFDMVYVPILGNHDLWPCTEYINPDEARPSLFRSVFQDQFAILSNYFGKNWEEDVDPNYVNYAFGIGQMKFVALDFVSRNSLSKGIGQAHDETLTWLESQLGVGLPTVLLSHIPLTSHLAAFPLDPLDIWMAIGAGPGEVLANFAGHVHGFYDEYKGFRPLVDNPNFMEANTELWPIPIEIPVVTTEAVMVGSNEPAGKGVIRIVKVRDGMIENRNIFEGEVVARAVNPYLHAEPHDIDPSYLVSNWDNLMQGKVPVDFESYAFTKRASDDYPLGYNLNFGDGTSTGWLVSEWSVRPPLETHWYGATPGKSYNATLTVTGFTPGGESIQESLTTTITPSQWLVVGVACPVDVILTDPDGLTISKQLNEILGASYMECDFNGDGDADDLIVIPDRKPGDYLIIIIPAPDASPTDTYSLTISAAGQSTVIADNIQISNIPTQPYVLRSTETDATPILPATIDFDPDTLNLKGKDKYVTAYIELPSGYNVSQIDISSIRLNGIVPALTKPTKIGDYDRDRVRDLMVKFDAGAIKRLLTPGRQVITVTGEVAGIAFEGSDTIEVIGKGNMVGPMSWLRWFLLWLVDGDHKGG